LDDLDNLDDLAVTDVTAAPSADDEAPAAGLAIGALVESLATEAEDTAEVPQEPADVTILKAGTIPPPAPVDGEDFTC
jgi:hypothetical protein